MLFCYRRDCAQGPDGDARTRLKGTTVVLFLIIVGVIALYFHAPVGIAIAVVCFVLAILTARADIDNNRRRRR